MYPTQLHSYLLWRSSVDSDQQALAKRRFTTTISLIPAAMVGMFVFGWYAAVVILISVATAFCADFICHRFVFTDSIGTRDGTWLLTGLLMALLMPPNVGYWVPIVGAIVAIVIGKYWLSVDNMSLLQPAAVGLLILFLVGLFFGSKNPMLPMAETKTVKNGVEVTELESRWPVLTRGIETPSEGQDLSWSDGTKMRHFIDNMVNGFFAGNIRESVSRKDYEDSTWTTSGRPPKPAVHGPRPIDSVKKDPHLVCQNDWLSLLLGYVPGTIGGSSALALGLGILFLIFTGAAHWATPIVGLATLFGGLHFMAWASPNAPVIADNILVHVLTGSTLLFIFYVAADPATSPRSFRGKVYAGIALGLFELFIRLYTPLAEGLFLSVVIVQGLSFVIDQWLAPPVEPGEGSPAAELTPSSLGRL